MKNITIEQFRKGLQELEKLRHEREYDAKNSLAGRILTITDAMTADADQRKAVKDLVQNAIWGGGLPLADQNFSLEARLYNFLTGEELWDEPTENVAQTPLYNPFEDKLK